MGLALSGGGIRSATLALGVLQALAGKQLLKRIDLLSTVSGGGYAGSFLGRLFTREWVWQQFREPSDSLPPEWPAAIRNVIAATDDLPDRAGERVRRVLDDHQSPLNQWLRDSGRYLSPTGSGDSLLAAAVSVRNWVAVIVVLLITVLCGLLLMEMVRAGLWEWAWWRESVEAPLMRWTERHWWWSPWLALPMGVALFGALPLGWAYWLTQKDDEGRGKWVPLATAAAILAAAGMMWLAPARIPVAISGAVGLVAALTLIAYCAANSGQRAVVAMGGLVVSAGGLIAQHALEASYAAIVAYGLAGAGFVLLVTTASQRRAQAVPMLRNRLSRWLAPAFLITLGLLLFAVVDSLGQMAYALLRPGAHSGWKAFFSIGGLMVLVTLARRIKLLLDQLPDRKAAQMPLSVLSAVAALVLGGAILISLSAVAHGFAWQWKNPGMTLRTSTPPAAGAAAPEAAFGPASNLFQRYANASRVELTKDSTIRVEDVELVNLYPLADTMSFWWVGIPWGVSFILTLFCGWTLAFLNLSSHQTLYAARLTRAYQGASNPQRWFGQGQRLGDSLPDDDIAWSDYRPHEHGGPLHLVNVTLNETIGGKTQIEYRDRQGLGMAVGPAGISVGVRYHALWSASTQGVPASAGAAAIIKPILHEHPPAPAGDLGAAAAENMGHYHALYGGQPEQCVEALRLGQWIGVSGAAFTTGLGAGTSVAKSFVLALTNIRLGYWWDSHIQPADRKKTAPAEFVAGSTLYSLFSSLLPVQAHLFDEMLARFRGPNSRLWYLSDGGHFENTGAYEMIRRRVPYIIVCDCGADPDYAFEDLARLTRMVRVDFGAEISFVRPDELNLKLGSAADVFGLPSDFSAQSENSDTPTSSDGKTATQKKSPHALLARIDYPDAASNPHLGGTSLMIVLKPGLSGDEPLDIAQYHHAYPAFPQETTLDQYFDEAQWESYRKLGRHIAEQVFPTESLFAAPLGVLSEAPSAPHPVNRG